MPEYVLNTNTGLVHIRGQCPDASNRESRLGTDNERVGWRDIGMHSSLAEAAVAAPVRTITSKYIRICKTCQDAEFVRDKPSDGQSNGTAGSSPQAERPRFTQDMGKFIEAVLYIGERSDNDSYFGVSKLARLLYYSDCGAYAMLGKPITGTTYIHFPHGPYPENWYQARMEMEQSGAITVLRDSHAQGYHRYGLLTNRPANRETLAPEEIEEMDAQLERFADYSAAAIEDYSQYEAAWLATEDGQPLAYELAGITAPPLSQNSIRHGMQVAKRVAARAK